MDLPHQFLLAENICNVPTNWISDSLGSWTLYSHPDIQIVKVLNERAKQKGWMLGWPIDCERQIIVSGELSINFQELEDDLYKFGGRWIVILVDPGRVYVNAAGEHSCVYCARERLVASTTSMLPPTEDSDIHYNLRRTINIPNTKYWYPFGLTAKQSVYRLLPNHYLDLNTFNAKRFWPKSKIQIQENIINSVEEITSIVKAQIEAIAKIYPLKANLTAGRDTRMILACARNHVGKIEFLTRASQRYGDKLDAYVAKMLSKKFNLNAKIIKDLNASDRELAHWQERVGHCVAGSVWKSTATWAQSDPMRANLPGMVAEVSRAYYRNIPSDNIYDASRLHSILGVPPHPLITQAGKCWLDGLPSLSERHVLDLLYLEQRLGCWAAPILYGSQQSIPQFWLLSHRRIISNMLSFPEHYKESERLAEDVISITWPELLQFPFNEPFGIGSTGFVIRDRIGKITRSVKKRFRLLNPSKPVG